MTRDKFFSLDITERLAMAISAIVNDHGPDPHNVIVFQDEDMGIHVSDMLHDAIVEIKRLRSSL